MDKAQQKETINWTTIWQSVEHWHNHSPQANSNYCAHPKTSGTTNLPFLWPNTIKCRSTALFKLQQLLTTEVPLIKGNRTICICITWSSVNFYFPPSINKLLHAQLVIMGQSFICTQLEFLDCFFLGGSAYAPMLFPVWTNLMTQATPRNQVWTA